MKTTDGKNLVGTAAVKEPYALEDLRGYKTEKLQSVVGQPIAVESGADTTVTTLVAVTKTANSTMILKLATGKVITMDPATSNGRRLGGGNLITNCLKLMSKIEQRDGPRSWGDLGRCLTAKGRNLVATKLGRRRPVTHSDAQMVIQKKGFLCGLFVNDKRQADPNQDVEFMTEKYLETLLYV